jgi:hypothetical protein
MRPSPLFSLSFVALALTAWTPEAHATPSFPAFMQQQLSISYTPSCALCHSDGNAGGMGTATTPFGISVRAFGTVAYDTGSLEKALEEMEGDSQCASDLAAVKAGQTPTEVCGNLNTIGYGCEIAPAPRQRSWGWLVLAAVGSAVVLGGRRRR